MQCAIYGERRRGREGGRRRGPEGVGQSNWLLRRRACACACACASASADDRPSPCTGQQHTSPALSSLVTSPSLSPSLPHAHLANPKQCKPKHASTAGYSSSPSPVVRRHGRRLLLLRLNLVHGLACPPVFVAQKRVPEDTRDVHDSESVGNRHKSEVGELEPGPYTPVCPERLGPALAEAEGDFVGRGALEHAHRREVEGDTDGGPAKLVHGDADNGVEGLAGGRGGRREAAEGPGREAGVVVEPPVELAGDGGKEETAVGGVADGPQVVVVAVNKEQLGQHVAGTKERAREDHVRHKGSLCKQFAVSS